MNNDFEIDVNLLSNEQLRHWVILIPSGMLILINEKLTRDFFSFIYFDKKKEAPAYLFRMSLFPEIMILSICIFESG